MKRIISLILSAVLLSSGIVFADNTGKYTDYMIEQGFVDNAPLADEPITREQAAVMIGRAIGVAKRSAENFDNPYDDVDSSKSSYTEIAALSSIGVMSGSDGLFLPDNAITREEFASVIERIYKLASNDMTTDEEVFEGRFVDFNDINEWARQSVTNVVVKGIFLADKGKKFSPQRYVTYEEAAEAVYRVSKIHINKSIFTESESTGDPAGKYSVYQKALIAPQGGIAGFGMVARFGGAPGEIYVSRKTTKPEQENTRGNPVSPVVFARVTDPDGVAIARVRLDYKENGLMEKVITINEGKAGIYQIQIINGRMNDEVAIGINGCSSWGVRGETSFIFTETTPKEGYIYVADKFENASIAASGAFSIMTEDNRAVASSSAINRVAMTQGLEISTLTPKTVYKLKFAGNFRGEFCMEGIPKLICPTAEMARDLKGNYVITDDGVQCHGPMQARAYEMAQKIYQDANGDFSVDLSGRPETLPDTLQNPLAESYNFGIYSSFLSSAKNSLDTIYLRPGAWLGEKCTMEQARSAEPLYTTPTWEVGNYNFKFAYGIWTGALTTNSELNWYYGEKGLIDRISLAMLYVIYSTPDDGWRNDIKNTNSAGISYATTYGNFCMGPLTATFAKVKNYLDPEVREVIQEGLEMIADKNMNFRGCGPSNQWGFGINLALNMWRATGEERYHDYFKRAIAGFFDPNIWPSYMGVAPAGYPIEAGGADGNYFYMNISDYANYHAYTKLPDADSETCDIIRRGIQNALEFESYLYLPAPEGLKRRMANHFTSRTDSYIGNTGGHSAWTDMIDEYPLAKRFFDENRMTLDEQGNLDPSDPSIIAAHYVNSDEYAWKKLKLMYDKYDDYFGEARSVSGGGCYETMLKRDFAEPCLLPCEKEDQVFEHPGIFAVKHKGIYLSSFYETTLPNKSIAANSWMGGAPSLIWSEGTGVTSYSIKHNGYSGAIKGENDVKSTCIFGTNAAGGLFVSGKEAASLMKDESGVYTISGAASGSSKMISWKYELTDEGIVMTPSVTPLSKDENYFINLPISVSKNSEYKVTFEQGRLTCEYKGSIMEFTWDENLYAEFADEGAEGDTIRRLRIKLSPDTAAAITIKAL